MLNKVIAGGVNLYHLDPVCIGIEYTKFICIGIKYTNSLPPTASNTVQLLLNKDLIVNSATWVKIKTWQHRVLGTTDKLQQISQVIQ